MVSRYSAEKKGLWIAVLAGLSAIAAIIVLLLIPHAPLNDESSSEPAFESQSESRTGSEAESESETESDSESESKPEAVPSGLEKLIAAALEEEGTVGGIKYSLWYTGFDENSQWCAIFLAWCAGQAGLIEDGIIPKYSLVTDYYRYYETLGRIFPNRGLQPQPGDIAFFDWEGDGQANHVGIVVEVDDTYVYIINGNNGTEHPSRNVVKLSRYEWGNEKLFAYARPFYS